VHVTAYTEQVNRAAGNPNSITGETHLVENYFQRRDKELTSSFLCFGTRSARSRSIV